MGVKAALIVATAAVLTTATNVSAQPLPAWAPKPFGSPVGEPKRQPAKSGAKPIFEFRSHQIGEPIEQSFPNWQAGKSGLFEPGCEKDRSNAEIINCDDPTSYETSRAGLMSSTTQKVGGVPISSLHYKFYRGRLYGVEMMFKFHQYSDISNMLFGRYGKPTRQKVGTLQNRMGATFDNVVSEWDFREGTMKLQMRYGAIDYSNLEFEETSTASQIRLDRAAQGANKGKSAF